MSSNVGRLMALLALLGAAAALAGCVEVATKVSSRGTIERRIAITVEARHVKAARNELAQMLKRGWSVQHRREGNFSTFICTSRGLDCEPPADAGIALSVKKRGMTAQYVYTETPKLQPFLPAREEQDIIGSARVRYAIEMPGKIEPSSVPLGFALEAPNRIVEETTLKLLPDRVIEVRSEAKLWTDLLFLIALALSIPGYVAYVILVRRARRASAS